MPYSPVAGSAARRKRKSKSGKAVFSQTASEILRDGMRIPFVDSFPVGFKRRLVAHNVADDKVDYVDQLIGRYVSEGVLVADSQSEVQFVANLATCSTQE